MNENNYQIVYGGGPYGGASSYGPYVGAEGEVALIFPRAQVPQFLASADAYALWFPNGGLLGGDLGVGLNHPGLAVRLQQTSINFLAQSQLLGGGRYNFGAQAFDPTVGLRETLLDIPLGQKSSLALALDGRVDPTTFGPDGPFGYQVGISFKVRGHREIKPSYVDTIIDGVTDVGGQALEQVTQTYFNPIGELPNRVDWTTLYEPYTNTTLGVTTLMTSGDLRTDREVILFQPIAIREDDGTLAQFNSGVVEAFVDAALESLAARGIPLDKFDVLIRKEPIIVDRTHVTDGSDVGEAPITNYVSIDQEEKWALFGYRSEKLAYAFQLIPQDGRSQSTGVSDERLKEVVENPSEIVRYINPSLLLRNLSDLLEAENMSDPNLVGGAILDSLWDGQDYGWQAALSHLTRMDGYVSPLYLGGTSSHESSSPTVFVHEGLGVHMLNLQDEYGRGEYTNKFEELRAKLAEQLEGKVSDTELNQLALALLGSGYTPAVFDLLSNCSAQYIVELVTKNLRTVAESGDTSIDESTRLTLTQTASALEKLAPYLPNTSILDLEMLQETDFYESLAHFDLINVAFSEEELWKKFDEFIEPVFPQFRDLLCVKEGGILEREGTYHFEWKKGVRINEWVAGGWEEGDSFDWWEEGADQNSCDNTQDTNAEDSNSAMAPSSPFALVIFYHMGAFGGEYQEYWDRPPHAPFSGNP